MQSHSRVRHGCGIDGMRSLEPESCDLVLSDLPSGATRSAFDKPLPLPTLWQAVERVLSPGGNVIFMASSIRFAAALIESNSAWFRYDLVWKKSMSTGFLASKTRPLRSHEFVLVFGPPGGHYSPQMEVGHTPIHAATRVRGHGENYGKQTATTHSRTGATDRFPGSVLEFNSVGTTARNRVHPQQKPVPLMQWLVRTYSCPGDLVCDPCAGSGSAGRAAQEEGRRFMGWDTDERFGHE